jgi:hypothetical protein
MRRPGTHQGSFWDFGGQAAIPTRVNPTRRLMSDQPSIRDSVEDEMPMDFAISRMPSRSVARHRRSSVPIFM